MPARPKKGLARGHPPVKSSSPRQVLVFRNQISTNLKRGEIPGGFTHLYMICADPAGPGRLRRQHSLPRFGGIRNRQGESKGMRPVVIEKCFLCSLKRSRGVGSAGREYAKTGGGLGKGSEEGKAGPEPNLSREKGGTVEYRVDGRIDKRLIVVTRVKAAGGTGPGQARKEGRKTKKAGTEGRKARCHS